MFGVLIVVSMPVSRDTAVPSEGGHTLTDQFLAVCGDVFRSAKRLHALNHERVLHDESCQRVCL